MTQTDPEPAPPFDPDLAPDPVVDPDDPDQERVPSPHGPVRAPEDEDDQPE